MAGVELPPPFLQIPLREAPLPLRLTSLHLQKWNTHPVF